MAFLLTQLDSKEGRVRLAQIYRTYHKQMEHRALAMLGQQADAEDAVQNAFVQVARHFDEVEAIPREQLPYWLISVVKNEAISILRKRRSENREEDWDAVEASAEETASYRELVALFSRLPETYRAVLEMKLLLGYKDREIAQHLGLSETAVSTRASRGRALLRKIIEKEGFRND